MIVLLKMLLAHLAGDFLFQPLKWVQAKEEKKMGAWQLYAHAFLHGALTWLFVGDLKFWPWALLIILVHSAIDGVKVILSNPANQRLLFFLDQLLHVISLHLIWLGYTHHSVPFYLLQQPSVIAFITAIVFLTTPVSFAVKNIISKWTPETEDAVDGSLQSAGKYIGILERLFIFVFIILGHWEGVGFLLAAKSIFRFGDLKESKDRKLTEYILIGTLLSFGLAIFTALLYLHLIRAY